ncbi:TetR/AcrR family transcriptional regulator [Variovorax sp. J22G40]|nr:MULTISPECIES: TetR/AcrR family transcriptional regulator [unclassified Variovorax]MDM0090101.1 TetR/AcrR family transcriptional regulator [Variovorax sp. J22G40]MDM0148233.1 TetR/AcrR family transcriptional regulator [Variovorax sp. J2P1-31]
MAQMGRPRSFDRDAALTQAMHLFWEQGFESTSLSQLKAAIGGGISAPSFYAAFGSKEALYEEAMARYLATHGQVTQALFDKALAPRDAIEQALRTSARMQCEAGHPRGCMVALGAAYVGGPGQEAITQPLRDSRDRTRTGILACVERGIKTGELSATTDAKSLAAVFDSFLLGLSIRARDGARHALLDAAITQVLTLWDAARARQR